MCHEFLVDGVIYLACLIPYLIMQVFAICAMRSIYTLVSHAISDLPYLKPAVALVLGFVGVKMFMEFFHYEVGTGVSLGVVSWCLFFGGGYYGSHLFISLRW